MPLPRSRAGPRGADSDFSAAAHAWRRAKRAADSSCSPFEDPAADQQREENGVVGQQGQPDALEAQLHLAAGVQPPLE